MRVRSRVFRSTGEMEGEEGFLRGTQCFNIFTNTSTCSAATSTSRPFTQYAQKGPDFSYPFHIVLCNFSSFFRRFDDMGGKAPSPLILPDGKGTVMNTAMYNACLTAPARPLLQLSANIAHGFTNLGGGMARMEIHLSTVHKLFKTDEPPLATAVGYLDRSSIVFAS